MNGCYCANLAQTVAAHHAPHADRVVGGGAEELIAAAAPAQRADRVHVSVDDLGDAARQKVPYEDAAVVAADGEQSAVSIELTRDGDAHAVERAVEVFGKVLTERLQKL